MQPATIRQSFLGVTSTPTIDLEPSMNWTYHS